MLRQHAITREWHVCYAGLATDEYYTRVEDDGATLVVGALWRHFTVAGEEARRYEEAWLSVIIVYACLYVYAEDVTRKWPPRATNTLQR